MNDVLRDYGDIINTEYPFDLPRPRMSISERAAQFSAFKALSGYEEEIDEAARLTDRPIDLDESEVEMLNKKLLVLKEKLYNSDQPLVQIVYFIPDSKKSGGAYVDISANIRKVDDISKTIQTTTGISIPIEDIYCLNGEIFEQIEQ